ncbi:MAG: Crp/Fnr family transcriptional regulator [Leptolyngbyaceae cyanobacterium MAG.088]|nr:Crp/Fnr family transcriptional regulator [Leptolyngbyaceae cyanobacterium MAG.088]
MHNYIHTLDQLFELGLIEVKPTVLSFGAGEAVFHSQDAALTIFGIITGKIQLLRYFEAGQQGLQYVVSGGDWFGEDVLFKSTYQSTAIAIQSSQVLAIPASSFLTLLEYDPDISRQFIIQMAVQLNTAGVLMAIRDLRSAQTRVLEYLKLLTPSDHSTCILDCSLKEIAAQTSLSPEAVSRSLRKLQDDGIIHRDKRKIIFL